MKSVEQKLLAMIEMIGESVDDAVKHGKGNKAAGTRVRKMLQTVANECKEIRKQVQSERSAE